MSTAVVASRLDEEVAALGGLSRGQIVSKWQQAHGCVPPKGVRDELLVRSAAWHCQAKQTGGFSADTRRRLKLAMHKAQAELDARVQAKAAAATIISLDGEERSGSSTPCAVKKAAASLLQPRQELSPGTRLLRDWNGRTHVVDVVEGGFLFEGKAHRSLSAIAKLITGAHWSGPRFFGLLP